MAYSPPIEMHRYDTPGSISPTGAINGLDDESPSEIRRIQQHAALRAAATFTNDEMELLIRDLDDEPPPLCESILWRITLCLVSLLFIWIASTEVIIAVVDYVIPSPGYSGVIDSWSILANTWSNQVTTLASCYNNEYGLCQWNTKQYLETFQSSIADLQVLESAALNISSEQLSPCQTEYLSIVQQFGTQLAFNGPVIYNTTACTDDQIQTVKIAIGDSNDIPTTNAITALASAQARVEQAKTSMMIAAQDVVDYTENFFSGVWNSLSSNSDAYSSAYSVIGTQLNSFYTQWNPSTVSSQSTGFSTTAAADATTAADTSNSVTSTTNILQPVTDQLTATGQSAWNSKVQSTNDTFYRAQQYWTEARSQLSNFGIQIDTAQTVLPDSTMTVGGIDLAFTTGWSYYQSTTTQYMSSFIQQSQMTATQTESSSVMFQTLLGGSNTGQCIGNTTGSLLCYDPPPINWDVNWNISLDWADSTWSNWANSLQQVKQNVSSEASAVAASIIAAIQSLPSTIEQIQMPDVTTITWTIEKIEGVIGPITTLAKNLWNLSRIADIVYRAMRSVKVIFYYGKASISQLPMVDLRGDNKSESIYCSLISYIPTAAWGPLIAIILALLCIGVIVIILLIEFFKWYNVYVNGCVTSSNGTFFTTNVYNIAFNLFNDTSTASRIALEQTSLQSSITGCETTIQSLSSSQSLFTAQLTLDKTLFTEYTTNLFLMNKCLNKPETYLNYYRDPTISGTIATGPWLVTSPYVNNTADNYVSAQRIINALQGVCDSQELLSYPWNGWEVNLPVNADSCLSSMPTCDLNSTCPVNGSILYDVSFNSACTTEWYANSFALQGILFVVMAICLNLSRSFLIDFFITFFYREMGTTNIEVFATYNVDTYECKSSNEKITAGIKHVISSHKCKAITSLLIGLFIQVPYVFCIFYFLRFSEPKAL